jgi:hypothetical protein
VMVGFMVGQSQGGGGRDSSGATPTGLNRCHRGFHYINGHGPPLSVFAIHFDRDIHEPLFTRRFVARLLPLGCCCA